MFKLPDVELPMHKFYIYFDGGRRPRVDLFFILNNQYEE